MNWFFALGGQSIGASASASVLLRQVGSSCSSRDSQESSPTPQFKSITSLVLCLLYGLTLISICDYQKKPLALTVWVFVGKVMSLLFHMLSKFVIDILLKSKCLLISLLQLPSAVILESKKIKSVTVSPSICLEVMGLDTMIFVF